MKTRAVSLTVQLLLTFVGLTIVTTVALTVAAYRASIENLDTDARRGVRLEAESRAQTVTQLLTLRQQRAEGFLVSVESLCGEPTPARFGWSEECVKTMTEEFRATEGSVSAELGYRGRLLRHAGAQVPWERPGPMALGRVIRVGDQRGYVMEATRGELTLLMAFTLRDVEPFFMAGAGLGRTGEVFLALGDGTFLTRPRFTAAATPPGTRDEPLAYCHEGAGNTVGVDYRGVDAIHGYAPVPALGDACVDAHIARDEALAPADQLWRQLALQGGVFVLLGALLSLGAARWIATPVRTLAESAGRLRQGEFTAGVPVDGPAEVRALGRAFEQMRTELSAMLSREQAARQDAEVANRAKDEFLAAVSHELRTPLTAILGWSRLLRDGRLDEARTTRAIEAITRSADAQRRLIEDLLDVSRIVSRRLRLVRGATGFQQVVESAVEAARPSATEKGLTLHYAGGAGPVVVFADAHRLEQVVWNLLSNAVKFTPPGGRVDVSLALREGEAELVVADTGIGISGSFLPHVFEWFRQDEAGVSRGGLGLGLGIVRQIVELHGGTITAQSPGAGHGSTFSVRLPLHDAVAPQAAPARATTDAFTPLDAVRVLVVDDDAGTRDVVRALLEDAGAVVETAASAAEAREAASRWHPHVLVSDVRMPSEDGYTLIRALRNADLDMPAIALTAYARRQDADEAYAAGFQVHMPKPADPRRLVDTIAGLAGGSSQVH